MHIIQPPLFDFEEFVRDRRNDRLAIVLEALPAERLIAALERERWTGRKGYWAAPRADVHWHTPEWNGWERLCPGVSACLRSSADRQRSPEGN